MALRRELVDLQLELVEQTRVDHLVLGPDRELVLRQKVPQREVLGDFLRGVLRRHLQKSARGHIARRLGPAPLLVWPGAHFVAADPAAHLAREGCRPKTSSYVPPRGF